MLQASAITWFVVQKRGSELVPFTVRLHCLPPAPALPNPDLEACLHELIEITAADPDRVDFNEVCLLVALGAVYSPSLPPGPANFPCVIGVGAFPLQHACPSGQCKSDRR